LRMWNVYADRVSKNEALRDRISRVVKELQNLDPAPEGLRTGWRYREGRRPVVGA